MVAHCLDVDALPPIVRIQSVVGRIDVALAHFTSFTPAPAARNPRSYHTICATISSNERQWGGTLLTRVGESIGLIPHERHGEGLREPRLLHHRLPVIHDSFNVSEGQRPID
jgi:hypothetical protein